MITISDILKEISHIKFIGNKNQLIKDIISLKDLIDQKDQSDYLSWCSLKNQELLKNIEKGTIICDINTNPSFFKLHNCNYIIVENPRNKFAEILNHFFLDDSIDYCIENSAIIDASANLGKNVKIGHNVVIEKNVTIGDNSQINHNTVIQKNTIIGENVIIGCNCTIGGNGFGFIKNPDGQNEFVPHIGNVIISDHVEIGNNNTIDRAVLGSTIIGKYVKTDNQVHIGHGVRIGENTLIAANATFSGSIRMGENVWVAPSTTLMNDITIGDNAFFGIGTIVLKNVEPNKIIVGNPGKELIKKNETNI
jgi:UDP-3-O-[3-hydroxymyristoyl] glucosamine N-acyltransferase